MKVFVKFVVVVFLAFMLFSVVPTVSAQDAASSFKLLNQEDATFSHTLTVIVPQSLYEYYGELSHKSTVTSDFPKFVTPYSVQPIADCLRQIYPDDEDFANGVLTLVHQIPYEEIREQYYPVETLQKNSGDCDMFSLLAASILKGGGLDVKLLHYPSEDHMNVGVHLDSFPQDARTDVYSFKNQDITYYVGECTSSNWQKGWRVGECPEDLINVPMKIVPLEDSESIAPGQVSASFKKLQSTTLDVEFSTFFALQGSVVTVNGQIAPAVSNQNVTLYVNSNGSPWWVLDTTVTEANGRFSYVWESDALGAVGVRASWNGNDQYAGTTSGTQHTLILPFYIVALGALALTCIIVCIVAFAVSRRNRQKRLVQQMETASYSYDI
ncbi:MAG: Ig-like domain-containing protein [Candidatus Bathyarchaeota archaeon]|nr:Ig-like domain-containing protein [Candidatus Bathyarchaeota archaeon]